MFVEGQMRRVTGLRSLYGVVAAVVVGFPAQQLNAQDEQPLAATPAPPPDAQQREKIGKPAQNPGKSPEVDELLQKLRLTRADIDKRKADKAEKELPATSDEPPDVKERKKGEKSPPQAPGRSPDLSELIEKLKKQPGGAEQLERARKAGAKIPPGKSEGASREQEPVRMAGPRMDGPVFDWLPEAQQPTMKATRAASYQTVAGLGTLWVYDQFPYNGGSPSAWGPLYRMANPNGWGWGSLDIKPALPTTVNVTTAGWYLVNFVATRAKATLRKYGGAMSGTPPMYPQLTQWDNTASANYYESYPYILNLAAGYHYFYFVPDENQWMYVSEVSVIKF
jgi:hypothetical protein